MKLKHSGYLQASDGKNFLDVTLCSALWSTFPECVVDPKEGLIYIFLKFYY